MPRNRSKSTPAISGGFLTYETATALGPFYHTIAVGSADWNTWLESATVFSYETNSGRFTARREVKSNRRGEAYWYGFKRHGKKLYKVYIGKPADLTQERLNEVQSKLSVAADVSPDNLLKFPGLADAFADCAAKFEQRWSRPWKWAGQKIELRGRDYYLCPANIYLGSYQEAIGALVRYVNEGRDNAAARRQR